MKNWKVLMTLLWLPLAYTALQGTAKAGEWNQATMFTFSAPVEVPGRVLPAGTYLFKLMSSASNRNIVEILNRNRTHLYATIVAIPDYRMRPLGRPGVTLEERAAGSPEAVHAWFYPGDKYGHEFLYPGAQAPEMAKAAGQQASAKPADLATEITQAAKSAAGLVASGARDTLRFFAKQVA